MFNMLIIHTVGIWIVDQSIIQMVQNCPVAEWSVIQEKFVLE